MRNLKSNNVGLVTARSNKNPTPDHFYVADTITEAKLEESSTQSSVYPLYLYPDEEAEQGDAFAATGRTVNFDPKIYAAICDAAGLSESSLSTDGEDDAFRTLTGDDRPTEVKVFDYIYGVLHSPDYRETYKEFLKIDFPRIPYPKDPEIFAHISEKGEALRRLHLMEGAAVGDTPYSYHGEGDDVVAGGYPKFEPTPFVSSEVERQDGAKQSVSTALDTNGTSGRVHINEDQYFHAVPELAWNFYIGGYQPAQKWLKDRKGRTLSWDDIGHYQKIIKILCETDRIMQEIELPLE